VVNETYNIGGHNEMQNIDAVRTICELLEELAPKYQNLIAYVTDRAGHDVRYAIDASKIQRKLNWTPQESFERGIRKTEEWYLGGQNR